MTVALGNCVATMESDPNPRTREALARQGARAGQGCAVSGCGMHGVGASLQQRPFYDKK